jgi:hypothetical protein
MDSVPHHPSVHGCNARARQGKLVAMTLLLNRTIRGGLLLTVAMAGIIGTTGCEERVVGVHNPFIGSQYEQSEKVQVGVVSQKKKGFFESMGDAMFGWMGPDDSKPRDADISERHSQTTTTTSGSR